MRMKQKAKGICAEAVRTYGIEKQSLIVCEELSELMKEVSKAIRKGSQYNMADMIEEIADVQIMIEQLEFYYGIEDSDIEMVIDRKTERLAKRMEER